MSLSSLFIQIQDVTLRDEILGLDALESFSLQTYDSQRDWISIIDEWAPDAAIVEVVDFSEEDYQRLTHSRTIQNMDLIIVSSGIPNPHLDKLMGTGGIFHYRTPVDIQIISDTLIDLSLYQQENKSKKQDVSSSNLDQYVMLVGSSAPMHKLYRMIRRVAKTEANVLIVGESGSGKELVAQSIHLASDYSQQPFIAINCGAIAHELVDSELFGHEKGAFTGANQAHQGVFDLAQGGTLFLDEITEMPLEHQVKLLRVLETGEYRPVGSNKVKIAHTRILAATNRDPQTAIEEQFLREDLYFRLAHFPVTIPPLRERGNDAVGLAKHFIAHRNADEASTKSILDSALDKIAAYHWPGNVRELKHSVERAFILADDVIKEDHLIFDTPSLETGTRIENIIPAGVTLEDIEKAAIINTLKENQGNKTETAQDLGISVKTLYNKLGKYGGE